MHASSSSTHFIDFVSLLAFCSNPILAISLSPSRSLSLPPSFPPCPHLLAMCSFVLPCAVYEEVNYTLHYKCWVLVTWNTCTDVQLSVVYLAFNSYYDRASMLQFKIYCYVIMHLIFLSLLIKQILFWFCPPSHPLR